MTTYSTYSWAIWLFKGLMKVSIFNLFWTWFSIQNFSYECCKWHLILKIFPKSPLKKDGSENSGKNLDKDAFADDPS